jgi:hydroxypyruvate isomerase
MPEFRPPDRDAALDRRRFLASAAVASAASAASAASVVAPAAAAAPAAAEPDGAPDDRAAGGRLKQSVCRWCYGSMPLEDLCREAARLGLASVELLSEDEWDVPGRFGLTCAVANGPGGITRGWNRTDLHDGLVARSEDLLPKVAAAGLPQMIVFSGNREPGLSDDAGLAACAAGLRRIMPLAEELGVTVVMELLNSKRDHGGYMCDRTPWGVELVERVGSDRFRLLYDIYHMQIMEGDVIATVLEHLDRIGHFHTGGVPGRREIDDTQELYYPRICRAIADAGFTGYLGQEFIPSRDPMASLAEAVRICTV